MWHLPETMNYQSTRTVNSATCEGVGFTIARLSFGRKLELTRLVRELGKRIEFYQAGESPSEKLDAAIAGAEIDNVYLDWGLISIDGLEIDGCPADKQLLIAAGPDALCREIVGEIRRECGLTDEEIKN